MSTTQFVTCPTCKQKQRYAANGYHTRHIRACSAQQRRPQGNLNPSLAAQSMVQQGGGAGARATSDVHSAIFRPWAEDPPPAPPVDEPEGDDGPQWEDRRDGGGTSSDGDGASDGGGEEEDSMVELLRRTSAYVQAKHPEAEFMGARPRELAEQILLVQTVARAGLDLKTGTAGAGARLQPAGGAMADLPPHIQSAMDVDAVFNDAALSDAKREAILKAFARACARSGGGKGPLPVTTRTLRLHCTAGRESVLPSFRHESTMQTFSMDIRDVMARCMPPVEVLSLPPDLPTVVEEQ